MTVWPASFFFWGASGICRRLQPSSFDSPNQPARTRVVSVWNTTQAPPTTYFGTGTPSTDASVASSRGERPADRSKPGNVLMLLPVFGTATPSTGTSVASPRGEEGIYRHFGTTTLPTGASEASQCGERPDDRSKCGLLPMLWPVFGTAILPTDTSEASQCGERPADRSMTGN